MKRSSRLKRSGFKRKLFVATQFKDKPIQVTFYKRPRKPKTAPGRAKTSKVGKVIKRPINLHRKAWDVFSKWIRQRDKICVTCGNKGNLVAGHFWHGVLDFDEMNINGQCQSCNNFRSGNLAPYSVYLINKYGLQAFKDLETKHLLALRGEFRTDQQYLDIIAKYKDN